MNLVSVGVRSALFFWLFFTFVGFGRYSEASCNRPVLREQLVFENSVGLPFKELGHIQGILVRNHRILITSTMSWWGVFNSNLSEARLSLVDISGPHPQLSWSVPFPRGYRGQLIHAGGLDLANGFIYIPLAEYSQSSESKIYVLNEADAFNTQVPPNLALAKSSRYFPDHLTGLISFPGSDHTPSGLVGFNWGAEKFFRFNLIENGQPMEVTVQDEFTNPKENHYGAWEYQDCKAVNNRLALCSGRLGNGLFWTDVRGVIDLIKFNDSKLAKYEVVQRWIAPSANGRPVSYNSFDYSIDQLDDVLTFYFIPQDGPDSALLSFKAGKAAIPQEQPH